MHIEKIITSRVEEGLIVKPLAKRPNLMVLVQLHTRSTTFPLLGAVLSQTMTVRRSVLSHVNISFFLVVEL